MATIGLLPPLMHPHILTNLYLIFLTASHTPSYTLEGQELYEAPSLEPVSTWQPAWEQLLLYEMRVRARTF